MKGAGGGGSGNEKYIVRWRTVGKNSTRQHQRNDGDDGMEAKDEKEKGYSSSIIGLPTETIRKYLEHVKRSSSVVSGSSSSSKSSKSSSEGTKAGLKDIFSPSFIHPPSRRSTSTSNPNPNPNNSSAGKITKDTTPDSSGISLQTNTTTDSESDSSNNPSDTTTDKSATMPNEEESTTNPTSIDNNTNTSKEKEFTGLFIFTFDSHGRILSHTIEHTMDDYDDESLAWERKIGLVDWLLSRLLGGRSTSGGGVGGGGKGGKDVDPSPASTGMGMENGMKVAIPEIGGGKSTDIGGVDVDAGDDDGDGDDGGDAGGC
ncbi:MAG: hypothetical protein M1823_002885 [Watsoniomyces obsoletus]|nr:MAG: hypothetical protein M1823_002885 [Watsoniomyces obsoletus]